jgi:hypothetical protein
MNRITKMSKCVVTFLLAALASGIAHLPSAVGGPPAPYHLIYGMVRDQYGTPLTDSSSSVILETPTGVQISGRILPGLAAGVNYQIKVPMDSGLTPALYRPDALTASAPFTLYVVVGTVTNMPIEMSGNYAEVGKPGGATRVNLTLGVDSNGDGIPDAWEQAYLSSLGLNRSLASLNGSSILGGQSLLQAYLAGSLFDTNQFEVTIAGFDGNSPIITFPATTGRSYTVLGSSDMNHWTPLSFSLSTDAPGALPHTFFYSSSIQTAQLQVNLSAPVANGMFLKVLLQ